MSVPWDDLEIVGFNGAPLVECGRSLPVARRKSDGMHCVLSAERRGEPTWWPESEALAYAAAQRWSCFVSPLKPPKSCLAGSIEEAANWPMVVFADDKLLDMADRVPRHPLWNDEYFLWRRLENHPENLVATCASAKTVGSLLDDWADGLLKRFDAMWHSGRDDTYLKRIADFALCAAQSRALRWRSYLRYALAQKPDRVRRTFDTFTQREFPDATWEAFAKEISSLADVLRAKPIAMPLPVAAAISVRADPKVRNIAAAKPLLIASKNGQ